MSILLKGLFINFLLFVINNSEIIAQNILNGDFEKHSYTTCSYNLQDNSFNLAMQHVYAFGKTWYNRVFVGEIDIQTKDCYVNPQHGDWCIGLSSEYNTYKTSDAIALELDNNLIPGQEYELKFYLFGNTSFNDSISPVIIGISNQNNALGTILDTIPSKAKVWEEHTIQFVADKLARYITVKNQPGTRAWNQIDHFTIRLISDVHNLTLTNQTFALYPNPVQNLVQIKTSLPYIKIKDLVLRNALGQIEGHYQNFPIDLNNYCPGIYCIEFDMNGRRATYKVLKQ